jgi:hydroxymethylbilane synthase
MRMVFRPVVVVGGRYHSGFPRRISRAAVSIEEREVSTAPIRRLTIATRESALALWQAEHIRARLATLHPGTAVELLGVTTQGDRVQDKSLAEIGGKGLFIKELEVALADGRADLAVHSLKDVPMEMPEGFTLAAICEREDPRDALVSNHYLDLAGLPGGARVGTSSPRREAQLRERDPLLSIQPLRGNVNTRLAKLDQGQYDAIILAAAGLKRLGLAARIASLLDPEECLPAAGQGALALECRTDRTEVIAALEPLADRETTLATAAERAFARGLSASCHTPLAAYAIFRHDELWLRGLLASESSVEVIRGERSAAVGDEHEADALGRALAADFLARGAGRLVAK